MPGIINKALFRRYCSSLNYFYTKDVNKIITKTKSAAYIKFKENILLDNQEEYLLRLYLFPEYEPKFTNLWKYHQFNIDQIRLFGNEVQKI